MSSAGISKLSFLVTFRKLFLHSYFWFPFLYYANWITESKILIFSNSFKGERNYHICGVLDSSELDLFSFSTTGIFSRIIENNLTSFTRQQTEYAMHRALKKKVLLPSSHWGILLKTKPKKQIKPLHEQTQKVELSILQFTLYKPITNAWADFCG